MNDIERGREVVENMQKYLDYESEEENKWGFFEPFVLHSLELGRLLALISHLEAKAARGERIEAAWWQYCNCGKTAWDFGCPYKCGMLSYCKGIALGGEE